MARVAKLPDVRRGELLDCAQALFFSAGYEATTIADIIARAGVSKGGFYHYFDSKESLLEAFAVRLVGEVLDRTRPGLEARDTPALDRLNAFFHEAQAWKAQSGPSLRIAFDAVLKVENDVLYHRIAKAMWAVVGPVLTELIREGEANGEFHTPSAQLAAEIFLDLALARQKVVAEAVAELDAGDIEGSASRLEARIKAEEAVMDRLLGVAAGSVTILEPGLIRAILAAMA